MTKDLEKKIEKILYSEMGFYSYQAKLKLLFLFEEEWLLLVGEDEKETNTIGKIKRARNQLKKELREKIKN